MVLGSMPNHFVCDSMVITVLLEGYQQVYLVNAQS